MSELFLEVFNIGIMASWLVLAVILVRILLKKAPAWVKCGLWAIVALRLVWPFEIQSLLSLIPSRQTLPPEELYHYTPEVNTGFSSLNSVINPTFTQVFQSEMANSVNPLQVVVAIASVVWVVGMIAMVVYGAVSYLRLWQRVRVSMPVGQGVYLCDSVTSPFILGIFKPRIYLPSELQEEKWESILAHERAHLARKDHWWKPLGFVLLTVFWFHPLLWVAYILLCRDVELACDEKVIGSLSDDEKKAYSETLLECSMQKKWVTACPLAFGETGVKQRIKAVLHYKKPALWIIIAALIVGIVLAFCFLTEHLPDATLDSGTYKLSYVGSTWLTSYRPENGGFARITDGNVLQYVFPEESSTMEWKDIGGLETVELSRKELLALLEAFDPLLEEDIQSIRRNTRNVWRVTGEYISEDTYVYLLQQKNGEYYCLGNQFPYKLSNLTFADRIGYAQVGFLYEKGGFGGNFTIILEPDGSFIYYEGDLSSYFGNGSWKLDGETLHLQEKTRSFYFTLSEDGLIFRKEGSAPFTYVDVQDGDRFRVFEIQQSTVDPEAITEATISGISFGCEKVWNPEPMSPLP